MSDVLASNPEEGSWLDCRVRQKTLVLSFRRPAQVMSWALLHGGLRSDVRHIINHHVEPPPPTGLPSKTLRQAASRLGLEGLVVGMITAVDIRRHCVSRAEYWDFEAFAVATAGCGNLATVGETGNFIEGVSRPLCVGTINLIVAVNYRLTHEAMLEAMSLATEAKVKAVYEARLRSRANSDFATGTGTDCVAIAVGPERRYQICGKHTKWGELVGQASLESIRGALRATSSKGPQNG